MAAVAPPRLVVVPEPEKCEPVVEDQRTREERIVRERWPMVVYLARKMKDKLPYNIAVEDLESSMAVGLLDAIRRFDPAKGVRFETYAPHRMRGVTLDALREADWLPRLARARHNRLEAVHEKLERDLGRVPTDPEIAGELGLSITGFDALRREVHGAGGVPLKRRHLEKDPDLSTADVKPDTRAESPLRISERSDLWGALGGVLTAREFEVVDLYYRQDMTLKEVGRKLGLSESRCCQLHAGAIRKARRRLGGVA